VVKCKNIYLGAQELLKYWGSIAFVWGPSPMSYNRCKYYTFSLYASSKQHGHIIE